MLTTIYTRFMRALKTFIFGQVAFTENEEYHAFRYKFLIVLMLSAAFLTGLLILGTWSQMNVIQGPHSYSMIVFTTLATVLWLVLRGHPERFLAVGWTYEIVGLLEYTSALVFVSVDELRILWFYINIPGVFILLGQRAGWLITVATAVGFMVGNRYLEVPYSDNAMATAILALAYLGVMFHAYVDRSMSFFLRMRAYNRKLQQLASHDPLTGVMNARAYYAACDQQIRSSERSNQSYAVMFVDLDHFKKVNDTYGHAAGDEVLRTVSATLQDKIRESDLLGRIGGEEFCIFLPATDAKGAMQLAENLRLAIEACKPDVGSTVLTVTASIGVAVSSDPGVSMQVIQERADQAMYQAKKGGRNRVSML